MQPDPVVAARVVDHGPQPQERLPGPQLGMQDGGGGGPLAGAAGPGRVEADRPPEGPRARPAPPRTGPAATAATSTRSGSETSQVALGRRVVVQVAGVAPVDQPPHPVQHDLPGPHPQGPVGGSTSTDTSPLPSIPGPATTGSTGPGSDPRAPGPAATAVQPSGRHGHGGQQPAPGWGDHPHLPFSPPGPAAAAVSTSSPQLVHVEVRWVGVVVDLEDEPVAAVDSSTRIPLTTRW